MALQQNHPFLPILGAGFICFLFAFYSLLLTRAGATLTPLWLPTAAMMVTFVRQPPHQWLNVIICCATGIMLAITALFPLSWIQLWYTAINTLEALIGATLILKMLPRENPLQNIYDWCKLVICSAVIPPIIGSTLVAALTHQHQSWHIFFTWLLSESIGALALVPLGLLLNSQHLDHYRNIRRLTELLLTLVITLALSWAALRFMPWPFTFVIVLLMWSAVRLPRLDAFLIFLATLMTVSLMVSMDPTLMVVTSLMAIQNAPWLPFLMTLLPANILTMVMYSFREESKHIAESEMRFRNAMEHSAIGMALVSLNGQWLQVNKSLCQFLGYSNSEMLSLDFQKITHPDDLNADLQLLDKLIRGEINNYTIEKRYIHRDGSAIWALLAVSMVRDPDGVPLYFIAQVEDINELKLTEITNQRLNEALYQEKERLHITLHSIGEAVICTDEAMLVTFMNPVAEKFSGWQTRDCMGMPLDDVLHITEGTAGPVVSDLRHHAKSHLGFEQDRILHNRHGGYCEIHYSVTPLTTQEGKNIGFVVVIQDVSESRNMLRQLNYRASHDGLTRLANRTSFENYLKSLLNETAERQQSHALVFIDLDRFKSVNDNAGHAAGDALLCELAILMQKQLRSSDFLARLGGDEFGVILPHCEIADARSVTSRLIGKINHYAFHWEGHIYPIGASAGITGINSNNCDESEIMAQADSACYTSKHQGRGRVTVYSPAPHSVPTAARDTPYGQLKQWLTNSALEIIAQPVSPTASPDSSSFWRLSWRLTSADNEHKPGQNGPIPFHDETILSLLDLRLAADFFIHHAPDISIKGISVSLPLSVATLINPARISEWLGMLSASPLSPRLVYLEITGNALNHPQREEVRQSLERLNEAGCRVILQLPDHNLELLGQINPALISYLMTDPLLIHDVHSDNMNAITVAMIHSYARRHNLSTIAGPVDLAVTHDILTGIGIDLVYGQHIKGARPIPDMLSSSYFAIN